MAYNHRGQPIADPFLNQRVGRVNLYGLDERGNIGVTWEGGDHESVPFKELRHADQDSPLYGKRVSKKHLKEVSGKYNDANMFSTDEVQVMRSM